MVKAIFTTTFIGLLLLAQSATAKDIIHDAEYAIMGRDMEDADIIRSVDASREAQTFTLDKLFVPNPAHMVTG